MVGYVWVEEAGLILTRGAEEGGPIALEEVADLRIMNHVYR